VPVFRFRLQPLLDRTIKEKEAAEEDLAERQKELQREQAALKHLYDEVRHIGNKIQAARRALLGSMNEGGDLLLKSQRVGALTEDLARAHEAAFYQKLVLEECEERTKQSRQILTECSQKVEALNKYRNKLERHFLDEVAQKEELEQDEIGNVLYLTRGRRL